MQVDQYKKLKIASYSGCLTGAFVNGIENLDSFQIMIGKKLAVVLTYVHWTDPFPLKELEAIYNNVSIPLVTWEPWITDPAGALTAISLGKYNKYVRDFLQAIKDWGKPVFLRFAHEMNGNWYPWDGVHNGCAEAPAKYKQAWAHIYNVIQDLKIDNIILVWSPNNNSCPTETWNEMLNYYPGDQYVDWLAVDGYNWGYGRLETFDQVFASAYNTLTALSNKPIMIAEFASAAGLGGVKAGWITDALAKIKKSYSRIKAFCWFNVNKERDWRINSSSSSEAAFVKNLKDDYFLAKIDT